MDSINIKVHPPWYARGTPVIKPRDGPAMAMSDKPLFAIREGPSARGKPGECMNAIMRECLPDRQVGMNEDGRWNPYGYREEVERPKQGKTEGKNPPLADVKNHIFQHANQRVQPMVCAVGKKMRECGNAIMRE